MSASSCVDPSSDTITTTSPGSSLASNSTHSTANTSISPHTRSTPKVQQTGTPVLESQLTDFQEPQLPPNGNNPDAARGDAILSAADIAEDEGSNSIESSGDEGEVSGGSDVGDIDVIISTNVQNRSKGVYKHVSYVPTADSLRNPPPLEERIKKAPKRLKQYRDYARLMEDRISSLEERLAQFEAERKKVKQETPPPPVRPAKQVARIPALNRVKWGEFKAPPSCPEEVCAIDVLVGEPVIHFQKPNRHGKRGAKSTIYTWDEYEIAASSLESAKDIKDTVKPSSGPSNHVPHGQLAERIRINSVPLLRIFEKIHGDTITSSNAPVLMFRPYRALMYYEEEIREWLKKLESKFAGNLDMSSASDGVILFSKNVNADNPENGELEKGERKSDSTVLKESVQSPDTDRTNGGDDYPEHTGTQEALDDIRCLIEFIDTDIKQRVNQLQGSSNQKIFFSDIWHLFKPGDEVLDSDQRQAYRVVQITGIRHHSSYANMKDWRYSTWETSVVIHCIYMDFNGKLLGPVSKEIEIPKFDGEREIRSLPVHPLRFTNDSEVRDRLIRRGKIFMELAEMKHMQFTGVTLNTQEEVDSQVVVDFEQTLQHNIGWGPNIQPPPAGNTSEPQPARDITPDCTIIGCCNDEKSHQDAYVDQNRMKEFTREQPTLAIYSRYLEAIKDGNRLRDDELVLLTHRLFVFILRSRKWAEIDISDVREVSRIKDSEGFDLLVLPDGHKEMVRSLVKQHFREKDSKSKDEEQVDLVRGKGKGLIILLHGAPGVGKTSTAECVADSFNKPLFPITCGDLGVTASDVESRLETNFTLAHRWGCVLLLDEADIFLAERTKDDFLRNSLVSVFLRVLEYYSGILFLTTNRVGAFDEAFKSRIHISLYYPPLDEESTIQIWEMNLERTMNRKAKSGFRIKDKEILRFAKAQYMRSEEGRWNGRQIRNAFQTAIALAEYDASDNKSDDDHAETTRKASCITLRKKHFEIVAKASLDFDKYLNAVYGGQSASDRAYDRNNRYDDHLMQNISTSEPSGRRYGGQRGHYSASRGSGGHGQRSISPAGSFRLGPWRSAYNDKPAKFPPRSSRSTRERERAEEDETITSESDNNKDEASVSNGSMDADSTDQNSESESAAEAKKKKAAVVKEKDKGKEKVRVKGKDKGREKEREKETRINKERRRR